MAAGSRMGPGRGRRRFLQAAAAGLLGLSVRGGSVLASDLASEEPAGGQPAPDAATAEQPGLVEPEAAAEFVPTGITPVTLAIPKLGVSANVVGVAQDPDGAMSAPANPDEVAWYTLGPGMGVPGNVVFAAHVNWDGRLRVFGRLSALEVGDSVLIVDAAGNGYQYVVESSQWFRAEGAPVDDIFAQPETPTITLITCGGEYRAATREYLDRLVVRARGA